MSASPGGRIVGDGTHSQIGYALSGRSRLSCGTFGVFRKIILPAVRPGIVTVALFAFLAAWNDFITPLILINDSSKAPLSLAITTLRQQTMGVIDYGSLEAGVVVMALPCLILFFALQGQYVRGFMSGAIKG
jgi:multiple sugar transport system permease protein